MSVDFRSKNAILSLISFINEYTGKVKTNLTDAVSELIAKSERGYRGIRGLCNGNVEELTAEDLKGITSINAYLFLNNTSLKYLELPDTVTVLGDNCFNGCTELDIPSLPEGIERLGFKNFYKCKKLSLNKLPDALNYIGDTAFAKCESLRISEIPAGVTNVGRASFSDCTSLETITFRSTPSALDRTTFSGCTNLTVINVPWAEGEKSYAPWGAENAVVNYNCSV